MNLSSLHSQLSISYMIPLIRSSHRISAIGRSSKRKPFSLASSASTRPSNRYFNHATQSIYKDQSYHVKLIVPIYRLQCTGRIQRKWNRLTSKLSLQQRFKSARSFAPISYTSTKEVLQQKCPSCGAKFQIENGLHPGYIPISKIKSKVGEVEQFLQEKTSADKESEINSQADSSKIKPLVCIHCHNLVHQNKPPPTLSYLAPPTETPEAINPALGPTTTAITDLSTARNSIILHLVDVAAFPLTFTPLAKSFGIPASIPTFHVFNKIDLFPLDVPVPRVHRYVTESLAKIIPRSQLDHVHLISAKSGMGIKELLSQVMQLKLSRGLKDIYLVGAINSGKSEFINCLLRMSKVPKGLGRGKILSSSIPGTTIDSIRLPLSTFANTLNSLPSSSVASTLSSSESIYSPSASSISTKGHLIDTPGLPIANTILPFLAYPEIQLTTPVKRYKPFTYKLPPGKSVLLGGLIRIDYLSGPPTRFGRVKLTFFLSHKLNAHVTKIEKAEKLLDSRWNVGNTELLVPPIGLLDRLEKLPKLKEAGTVIVENKGGDGTKSQIDFVLAGIGWCSVTWPKIGKRREEAVRVAGSGVDGGEDRRGGTTMTYTSIMQEASSERIPPAVFKVYTPSGVGFVTRPPLLPYESEKNVKLISR
ncbi:hypothetical protein BKA69DRAFT_1061827 [Paraphysoderma sedebokerense]|nr:hypothetical protein BKA69DRAFT_1061827 [Paraphysoderma sedebokerense]